MAKSERISQLARNIQKNPDDSFSKFALALELLKRDQLPKAKRLFESIHQSDPEYLGVYYHLGKLQERIGNEEEARKLYNEGIDRSIKQSDQHTAKELREALELLNHTR